MGKSVWLAQKATGFELKSVLKYFCQFEGQEKRHLLITYLHFPTYQ